MRVPLTRIASQSDLSPQAGRGKQKDRPRGTGLSTSTDSRRSETLVRGRSRLVDGVLGRFLGVADGLLALALHLLDHAFAFKTVGACRLTNALLGLADSLVAGALDLVSGCTH